jgi:hypothetical protein
MGRSRLASTTNRIRVLGTFALRSAPMTLSDTDAAAVSGRWTARSSLPIRGFQVIVTRPQHGNSFLPIGGIADKDFQ